MHMAETSLTGFGGIITNLIDQFGGGQQNYSVVVRGVYVSSSDVGIRF
jgi:hypothetical protein